MPWALDPNSTPYLPKELEIQSPMYLAQYSGKRVQVVLGPMNFRLLVLGQLLDPMNYHSQELVRLLGPMNSHWLVLGLERLLGPKSLQMKVEELERLRSKESYHRQVHSNPVPQKLVAHLQVHSQKRPNQLDHYPQVWEQNPTHSIQKKVSKKQHQDDCRIILLPRS